MAMTINTNVSSLNAQRNLTGTQGTLSTAMERLSSGLRINSAKDDAAGLAISDRMTSQIGGMNQAVRNANDAISLAQTAEGAMQETTNLLQRMRDLSIQSANGTNSASDRANLQKEVAQLQAELDRIGSLTEFNGKKLLDGSFITESFHVGANANENVTVNLGNIMGDAIGSHQIPVDGTMNEAIGAANTLPTTNTVEAGAAGNANAMNITGPQGSVEVPVNAGATARDLARSVNAASVGTGVEAEARTQAQFGPLNGTTGGTVAFKLTGKNGDPVSIMSMAPDPNDLSSVADAINGVASQTGITAKLAANGSSMTLISAEGYDIGVSDFGVQTGGTALNIYFQGMDANGNLTGSQEELLSGGTDSSRVGGTLTFTAAETFVVTSDNAGLFGTGGAQASTLSDVAAIDISSAEGANAALNVIDGALMFIDTQRADLGAIQNRLESTISNLSNITENLSAARSRIQDADFAQETAALSKGQILQQAGVAMLSQANSSPEAALSLLQG